MRILARFMLSASDLTHFPAPSVPEIAFLGRSIAPRSMYAESARLLRDRLPQWGITTTFVDAEPDAYAEAITSTTRLIYVESPANPNLAITDVVAVAEREGARARDARRQHVRDPFAATPLALGVDLVVHSVTKAIGGHGDAIGGAVCGRRADVPASASAC